MAQFGSTQLLMMIVVLLSSVVTFLEAARSAGCDAESPIIEGSAYAAGLRTGQSSKHSMRHNGVWRYFNAHLPAGYDHTIAYPLILSFHGWGSDKETDEYFTGFSALSDAENVIIVYPDGLSSKLRRTQDREPVAGTEEFFEWMGGQGQGGHQARGHFADFKSWNVAGTSAMAGSDRLRETCDFWNSDNYCYDSCDCARRGPCQWTACSFDVTETGSGTNTTGAFIPTLMDLLEDTLCIDTAREYATGMSNGGMAAYQLGVALSHRFAAIAPVAATFPLGSLEVPEVPVAVMHLHGTRDSVIPALKEYSDMVFVSRTLRQQYVRWEYTPTAMVLTAWAEANKCSDPTQMKSILTDRTKRPREGRAWLTDCTEFGSDCEGGAVAARCLWNGEHEYLGNALTYAAVHAPFVYDFLRRYTKPSHVGKGEVDETATTLGSVIDSRS